MKLGSFVPGLLWGPTGDLAFIAIAKGALMTKESLGNAFRDAIMNRLPIANASLQKQFMS